MALFSSEIIRSEYHRWLCDTINVNMTDKSYWLLVKALHKKEFYWTVPNDDNRAQDGKKLRERFAEEKLLDCSNVLDGPCSVLEMLIALAIRMEDIMTDMDHGDRTSKWFWEMIGNAGLDEYTDDAYARANTVVDVDNIIVSILDRTYKRDGRGGLFPLRNPEKDQRQVEIWYQMSVYLNDKYYIN